MKISTILKTKGEQVYTISPDATMKDMVNEMLARRAGSLLVTDTDGRTVGIVTERDLLRNLRKLGAEWEGLKVEAIMSREVVFGNIDDTIDEVMSVMTERRIRHLPVMDGERLAGVLSMGDIINAALNESTFQNKLLKTYIKNWPDAT